MSIATFSHLPPLARTARATELRELADTFCEEGALQDALAAATLIPPKKEGAVAIYAAHWAADTSTRSTCRQWVKSPPPCMRSVSAEKAAVHYVQRGDRTTALTLVFNRALADRNFQVGLDAATQIDDFARRVTALIAVATQTEELRDAALEKAVAYTLPIEPTTLTTCKQLIEKKSALQRRILTLEMKSPPDFVQMDDALIDYHSALGTELDMLILPTLESYRNSCELLIRSCFELRRNDLAIAVLDRFTEALRLQAAPVTHFHLMRMAEFAIVHGETSRLQFILSTAAEQLFTHMEPVAASFVIEHLVSLFMNAALVEGARDVLRKMTALANENRTILEAVQRALKIIGRV